MKLLLCNLTVAKVDDIALHPIVLLAIFIILALDYFVARKKESLHYDFQGEKAKSERKFSYLFQNMIGFDYAKELRINRVSDWLVGKYDSELSSYMDKYGKLQKKHLLLKLVSAVIDFMQTIMMYGYCVYQVLNGSISVGSFSIYLGAITNFSGAFMGLIEGWNHIIYLSRVVDDYKKYEKLALPTHLGKGKTEIEKESGIWEIEFVHVSFRYPNTEKYVLKDVSIKIENGEKLSVVGYNGAGKSTFIKLLCRLYEPTKGQILYNGIDIGTIKYEQYRELLSVVFQDYRIFAFSAADNITLNRPFDKEKIMSAIEKSGLHAKFETLDKGLETSIGREFDEAGIEFSGGEGQKLACARAYYKDAPIVILDEPTAAMDPIAENELYERFHSIMGDKTAIYISHRMASVRFCDKVAVFVGGEIVEYGNHEELLNRSGVYADMFQKQAEYYVSEGEGA